MSVERIIQICICWVRVCFVFKVTSGRLWKIAADTDQGRHPAAGAFTQVDERWELRIQRAIKEKGGKTGGCRGRGVVCLAASGQSTMDGLILD